MLGIALAGLLATSLGSSKLAPNEARLTAKLEVASLQAQAPKLLLREGAFEQPPAPPEPPPPPDLIPAAHEEVREPNKAWLGAGIAGGAVGLGVGAGLIAGTATTKDSVTTGWAVGASTALVGGLGGYFLGKLAGEGSLAAQIGVVVLDTAAVILVSYGVYRT